MPVRFATALVTAVIAAALALPGGALALGSSNSVAPNPLAPGIPASPAPSPTPTPAPTPTPTPTPINPTTTSSGDSLGGGGVAAISIGAVLLLGGISFFIWRDARRRAPVRHAATAGADGRSSSKRAVKPRKLSPAERRRRKRGRAR